MSLLPDLQQAPRELCLWPRGSYAAGLTPDTGAASETGSP